MPVKLIYFAWVRERIGVPDEAVELPEGVTTISALKDWLASRGENYAYAFENPGIIRAAIDQRHATADASIAGAREIAFFPPMTGG
jgi:molybdopterin synthase sulfur carrier subunit